MSFFISAFVEGFLEIPILSNRYIIGINTTLPIRFLMQLKVYGPINSPPELCATNANPQISAAINSKIEFLV